MGSGRINVLRPALNVKARAASNGVAKGRRHVCMSGDVRG